MKNKILLVCLLASQVAWGQFAAGTKMLQGDFNLQTSFNGNDKDSANSFSARYINASVGAQIANIESETHQWGFGTRLLLLDNLDGFTNKTNTSSSKSSNHNTQFSFTFNVFQTRLKKLLPNFYGGFRYSSGLGYSVTTSKSTAEQQSIFAQPTSTATNTSNKYNSVTINVGITSQFYYFISPKWGLSANIGYVNAFFTHNFKAKIWAFDTSASFNGFGLGVFKILYP
jgi:hypothetical protein